MGYSSGSLIAALAASAAIFAACSRGARVIPPTRFADIYAEMLLADQWVSQHPGSRRVADTSDVYAPILERYGYSVEDYDASMRKYLRKPDDYAKILKDAAARLDAEAKRLQSIEDAIARRPKFSPYEPVEFRYDTLVFRDDSTGLWPNDSSFVVTADSLPALLPLKDSSLATAAPSDSLSAGHDIDTTTFNTTNHDRTQIDSQKVFLLHGSDDSSRGRHPLQREIPREVRLKVDR